MSLIASLKGECRLWAITLIQETKKKVEKACVKELYIALSKEPKNVVFWRGNCLSKLVAFF